MASRFRKRKKHMDEVQQELELMPMLNVFISIIPLLLLSAAFVEVAVIPASVTADSGAPAVKHHEGEAPFDVAVALTAKDYVVEANGIESSRVPRDGDPNAVRASLVAALQKAAAGHPDHHEVRVVAPATTRYEDVIGVMDAARAAGLPNAALDGEPQGDS